MSTSSYDFIKSQLSDTFRPPVPEHQLKQHSEKLVFSNRMFPEWVTAAYAVFKKRYPDQPISSASELFQLVIQDYIKQNFELVDEQLPTTEDSLNFLIRAGFINPQSKVQFKKISNANHKATEYEAEALSSGSLKQQYNYYKNRDPEKAEEIMQKMQEEFIAGLEQEDSQEQEDIDKQDSSEETVVSENRSGLANAEMDEQHQVTKPSLDYLDDIKEKE